MKTQSAESGDKAGEYRQLLVQSIHSCAVKFPDVAGSVVYLLMDFMGDSNTASALDVVFFVREIMETNAKLRDDILQVSARRRKSALEPPLPPLVGTCRRVLLCADPLPAPCPLAADCST